MPKLPTRLSRADFAHKKTSPLRYAIGMFGTSIPINMFKTFALVFYVDGLGLDSKKYALVLTIYAFIDALDNPVYGYLSDHTRSRWGRRKPWLVIGTPLLIVFFLLFFSPPDSLEGNQNALFAYVLLTYVLTGTLDSLINANYGALFPELFLEDAKRTSTNAMRQAFQLVAMAISIALTPMVTEKIGYSNTALVYGLLALAVILYCAFGCHENPDYQKIQKPPLLRSVWELVKNPKFWKFGLTNAFYSAAFSLVMSAIPLYTKYVLHSGGTQTMMLMGSFLVVALAGVAVWAQLVKRFGVMTCWRAALALMCLGFVPLYFMHTLYGVMAVASIVAFGAAGSISTMDVVGARVMDDDFRRYGIRREGIIASALGVLGRLNGLFTALALWLVNERFGYESGENPGENPARAVTFLLVIFPAVAMLLSFGVSWLLRFNEAAQAKYASETAAETAE